MKNAERQVSSGWCFLATPQRTAMCEAGVEENVVELKLGLDCKDVGHLIVSHLSLLAGFHPTSRLGFTILSTKDASSALDTPRRTSLWTAEHFCKGDLTVTLHSWPPGHGWKVCPMLVPLEPMSSKVKSSVSMWWLPEAKTHQG